jgi:hypothetical protein
MGMTMGTTGMKTIARTMNMTQHPHLHCKQLLAGGFGGARTGTGTGTGMTNADTTMARQPKTMRMSPNHHSKQLLIGWKQGAIGTDNRKMGLTAMANNNGKR